MTSKPPTTDVGVPAQPEAACCQLMAGTGLAVLVNYLSYVEIFVVAVIIGHSKEMRWASEVSGCKREYEKERNERVRMGMRFVLPSRKK